MQHMMLIAGNEGIRVRCWSFEPPVLGIYWAAQDMPPYIGLDKSLMSESPLTRCVMAEELGHHFTTFGDTLTRTYFHYSDRLNTSQAEFRAYKWAARYLMPKDRIERAFCKGIIERWELAEYFDVTEMMVNFRLRLPDIGL